MNKLFLDKWQSKGNMPVSAFLWHEVELKKTEAAFLANNIEAVDWSLAKKELRRHFE